MVDINLVKLVVNEVGKDLENEILASLNKTTCNEEVQSLQQAIGHIRSYFNNIKEEDIEKYQKILRG